MNKDLEKTLIDEFPSFFRDMYGDPKKTGLDLGCDILDGWYPLLKTLCEDIERECKKDTSLDFKFTQIKEKFGFLCVYCRNANDRIYQLIDSAEYESENICEKCGSEEDVTTDGDLWDKTFCSKCHGE